ncbi:glycoside hydrolase family 16 protein, partial [Tulasnella calospora MUT 4182]
HNNIVKVIGFVEDVEDGTAWVVLPWEKSGNLREFVASANWELPERVALIYDVASGIQYLHNREPPICHGDLKSLNVLINSKNEAVITDFGSALGASGETITLTAAQWTLRWAAPELLTGSDPDLASDIWAFGWICWEVMTGGFPFEGGNDDVSVVVQIIQGKLPPVHGDGRVDQVTALANLMIDCWSLDPSKRPVATSC